MSQEAILKILKKSKKSITVSEIRERFGLSRNSINHALSKLYKQKRIKLTIKKIPTIHYKKIDFWEYKSK